MKSKDIPKAVLCNGLVLVNDSTLNPIFITSPVAARRAKSRGGGTLELGENMEIFENGRMWKKSFTFQIVDD